MLSVRALRLFGALTGLARADPSVLARQAPAPCLRTLQQHSWGVGSLQRSYAQLTQATSNTSRPAGSSRRPLYPPLDLADRVVLLTGVSVASMAAVPLSIPALLSGQAPCRQSVLLSAPKGSRMPGYLQSDSQHDVARRKRRHR